MDGTTKQSFSEHVRSGTGKRVDQTLPFSGGKSQAVGVQNAARFWEAPNDFPDGQMVQVAASAARLVNARACMIMLLEDGELKNAKYRAYWSDGQAPSLQQRTAIGKAAACKAIEAQEAVLVNACATSVGAKKQLPHENVIASPIRVDSKVVGAISILQAPTGRLPRPEEVASIDSLAWFVGGSLQCMRLQGLLGSQFAQRALAEEARCTGHHAMALTSQTPDQLAKMLAKSFYREMVKAGFSSGQIINAASEIISQLSSQLQKYSSRCRGTNDGRKRWS